MGIIFVQELI